MDCIKVSSNMSQQMMEGMVNGMMKGKRGIIMGVTNESSIAWGIARELISQGAELAFTYPSDPIKMRIEGLVEQSHINSPVVFCDVSKEGAIAEAFAQIGKLWGEKFDFILHSIAFSDRHQLTGPYLNTTRDNFLNTMLISCYSLTEVCRESAKFMKDGGSVLAMTYFGAEKVVPHYNVMGIAKSALESSVRYLAVDLGQNNIRVNAISAGALRTAASSGIGDFHYIMNWYRNNSPLRRNVELSEVGRTGLYLLSDMSSGVTGEILHVDCGYNIIGMKTVDAPDLVLEK